MRKVKTNSKKSLRILMMKNQTYRIKTVILILKKKILILEMNQSLKKTIKLLKNKKKNLKKRRIKNLKNLMETQAPMHPKTPMKVSLLSKKSRKTN